MTIYEYPLKTGIARTREFERKRLATHAVNVGTKCGHGCTYCSSGAMLRMHPSFESVGRSAFDNGYAIVDPSTPQRVARDARRIRNRGVVQLCTTVDAWAPEATEHELGRRCLQAILTAWGWTVRILTKNAAVTEDFDLIEEHRDDVLVGLSITAPPEMTDLVSIIEPNASPLQQRLNALWEAHCLGLRTYAMLSPLLPGIASRPHRIDQLVQLAADCGAEEIFAEPVNPRGNGLMLTQHALKAGGYDREAEDIERIRCREEWSGYVVDLVRNLQRSARRLYDIRKLRFLLYPSGLTARDADLIRQDDAGVIWLGKDTSRTEADHAQG